MQKFSLPFLLLLFVSCGSLEDISLGDGNPDVGGSSESIFLFGTDYASSGQLYTADFETLSNTGVTGLGSSAVIRFYDGLLYVLHDGFSIGSSDNIQVIDPSNNFLTLYQWSTGNGTNPHDVVVVGNLAFISLYNPENDEENLDDQRRPGDLIIMNLDTGEIEKRISFQDYLNDDGSFHSFADQMVLVGEKLYVCLQDLEEDFSHNAEGKIGVVNVETEEIEEVIFLAGRNPVDIAYSENASRFFVALAAPYDYSLGNFDTSTNYGGIEIVGSTLIPDEALGGYVERLAAGGGKVFAVVSEMDNETFSFTSDIVTLDEDAEEGGTATVFLSGSDVREIAVDSSGRLWISYRTISSGDSSASDPGVDVYDSATGSAVGPTLYPDVPITSIVFGGVE